MGNIGLVVDELYRAIRLRIKAPLFSFLQRHCYFTVVLIIKNTIMPTDINWEEAIKPLLKNTRVKTPVGLCQCLPVAGNGCFVGAGLDRHINQLAPKLFEAYPDMATLSPCNARRTDVLYPGREECGHQGQMADRYCYQRQDRWRHTIETGSAYCIVRYRQKICKHMREAGAAAEGIIVDLHVLRVAPWLGIASGTDAKNRAANDAGIAPETVGCRDGHVISRKRNLQAPA